VLNADDAHSLAILPRCGKRQPWLVSQLQSAAQLREAYGAGVNLCVVEKDGGEEWLYLDAGSTREPLLRVADIPLTRGGRLRFNVSNVMQAICACLQQGVPLDTVRQVVAAFQPSYEDSAGRQNLHRGPRFSVLFDYAHNEEGHRVIADWVQDFDVPGRRILNFGASAAWRDEAIMSLAHVVAGRYDLYICRDYPRRADRQPGDVGALLMRGLRERGVPEDALLHVIGDDYLDVGLRLCREGDLMVYAVTNINLAAEWATITSWPGNTLADG